MSETKKKVPPRVVDQFIKTKNIIVGSPNIIDDISMPFIVFCKKILLIVKNKIETLSS